MAKTGGGSIVNISSIMGFVGSTGGHPAYHASKGAVRIYSKAAAVRYGPMGVRVNTVHPGYMPPMLNATNAGERDEKIALTPLRRIGQPIEVAYRVLFLASDEASFVTGAARHRRRLHCAIAPVRGADFYHGQVVAPSDHAKKLRFIQAIGAGRVIKWQGDLVGVDLGRLRRMISKSSDRVLARAGYAPDLFRACCRA